MITVGLSARKQQKKPSQASVSLRRAGFCLAEGSEPFSYDSALGSALTSVDIESQGPSDGVHNVGDVHACELLSSRGLPVISWQPHLHLRLGMLFKRTLLVHSFRFSVP